MPLAALLLALASAPVETIRLEMTGCYGTCPVYVVTVSSDGRGVFDGRLYTAAKGPHPFHVTPAQFAAFAARLRPATPHGEVLIEPGQPLCRSPATDQISVDVRWTGGPHDPRHLRLYFGCALSGRSTLKRALVTAPETLPIAALVGRH